MKIFQKSYKHCPITTHLKPTGQRNVENWVNCGKTIFKENYNFSPNGWNAQGQLD